MKGLVLTYVLTYGGALASLFRPFVGLLVYVCFAIVKPEAMWYWAVPEGNYSRIVAVALLVGWALHGFGVWRLGRARGVVFCLAAFWLVAAALVPTCFDPRLGWDFVEAHLKILLPFLVGVTVVTDVRQLKQLAWVIVLSQGYVALELNVSYYEGFNRLQQVGFAGSDNNTVAITMDSCIGLAFFLGLHSRGWWRKGLAFAAALLMTHAVMFSFSRGGLLALVITGVVAFVLIPKGPRHYVLFVAACLVALRLAGPEVVERFWTTFASAEQRDASAQMRVRHWDACLDSVLHHPLGVGPNQWRYASVQYGLPSMEAHSYWLQTVAELGVPGLLAIAAFYSLCVVRLWPLARERVETSDPWLSYLARMVIASLVGFVVSAQFVSVIGVEVPFYVALLGVGVLKLHSLEAYPAAEEGFEDAPSQLCVGQGADLSGFRGPLEACPTEDYPA
jgi:hypothetical protein